MMKTDWSQSFYPVIEVNSDFFCFHEKHRRKFVFLFSENKSKLTFLSTLLPNDFPYYIDKKIKKEKKKKRIFFSPQEIYILYGIYLERQKFSWKFRATWKKEDLFVLNDDLLNYRKEERLQWRHEHMQRYVGHQGKYLQM